MSRERDLVDDCRDVAKHMGAFLAEVGQRRAKGSGSTLIAAERQGRICYGVELDPAYVDVVVRRWQTVTGLTAKVAS